MMSLSSLKRFTGIIFGFALLTMVAPTWAASVVQVTSFGNNPGALAMYKYVPDGLSSGRPLVVAMHGCTQTASNYDNEPGWTKIADQFGFAVVFPETNSSNNSNKCFNWYQSGDISRGQGEAASIISMVNYMKSNHGSASDKIFVTGLSAGGAMTSAMLGSYPDVFAGGAIVAGIPYKCALDLSTGFSCMNPGVNKTPQQWGDLVRGGFSGYTGPWPKVAIIHGSSDGTVNVMNLTEMMEQWTNVHGISQTPTTEDTIKGFPRKTYSKNGVPVVQTVSVTGMAHGTPIDPGTGTDQCGAAISYILDVNYCSSYYIAQFWGITGGGSSSSSSSSSSGGGTTIPPVPTGLTVTGKTSSSVSLSWGASSGATSYKVYRGTTNVGSPTGTTFTDTGLSANTTYTYQVSAVNSAGESAKSGSVSATTNASGGTCYTATNWAHYTASRAHSCSGYACADGSNQNMGLLNTYVTTKLRQTGTDYYVIDNTCP